MSGKPTFSFLFVMLLCLFFVVSCGGGDSSGESGGTPSDDDNNDNDDNTPDQACVDAYTHRVMTSQNVYSRNLN